MQVDPNQPLNYRQECILCEDGKVILHDGSSTSLAELEHETSAFKQFCHSLDPNKCFIVAFIPNDADKNVFFRAREVAGEIGLHMQAPVDFPEKHRSQWEMYTKMKRYADVDEEGS